MKFDAALDAYHGLGFAVAGGIPPAASIGASFYRDHECLEAWDMTSDWIGSLGLTLMLTNATKVIASLLLDGAPRLTKTHPPCTFGRHACEVASPSQAPLCGISARRD